MVEKVLRVFSIAALYVAIRYTLHVSGLDIVDSAVSIPIVLLAVFNVDGWIWRLLYGLVAVSFGMGASLNWPNPGVNPAQVLSLAGFTGLGTALLLGKRWVFLSAALVALNWIVFGDPRWISVVNYLLTVGIYTALRKEG